MKIVQIDTNNQFIIFNFYFFFSPRMLGIEVIEGHWEDVDFSAKDFSGALIQYPDTNGQIQDFKKFVDHVHQYGV